MNEALRDWVTNVADTFYCIGTAAGPHPYPAMVRDFQCVIGNETRAQMIELEGRLPDSLVAAIGGGSNAIGLFHPFLDDEGVEMFGVEAAGHGLDVPNGHAASITGGRPGVLHGNRTYLLQTDDGQILEGHSISAGLDYPGVGPEHAWLHDVGRVTYLSATDKEALDAFQLCSKLEGIIPALEPAHALAKVIELAPKRPEGPPDGDEHVRPGRQGYFRRRRPSRRHVVRPSRSRRAIRAASTCQFFPASRESRARFGLFFWPKASLLPWYKAKGRESGQGKYQGMGIPFTAPEGRGMPVWWIPLDTRSLDLITRARFRRWTNASVTTRPAASTSVVCAGLRDSPAPIAERRGSHG